VAASVVAGISALLIALIAFILNQWAQLRGELRENRLARINSQLRDLYGPLHALVLVNERVWVDLRTAENEADGDGENSPVISTDEWRKWWEQVLLPNNIKMRDLIIQHADLHVGSDLPGVLRDICSHVAYCEALVGNGSAYSQRMTNRVYIPHPRAAYVSYIGDTFRSLKAEQERLLNLTGAA
jgi:hypothetical protein